MTNPMIEIVESTLRHKVATWGDIHTLATDVAESDYGWPWAYEDDLWTNGEGYYLTDAEAISHVTGLTPVDFLLSGENCADVETGGIGFHVMLAYGGPTASVYVTSEGLFFTASANGVPHQHAYAEDTMGVYDTLSMIYEM